MSDSLEIRATEDRARDAGAGMSTPPTLITPPKKPAGPAQREVVVFPQADLRKGEGVVLRFESGETLPLVKGHEGAFRGLLPRARLEDPFSVHRTPGDVPEVGFHGQGIPRRTAPLIDEPLWIYPVAWADRLPRGTYPTRSGLHQDIVLRGSDRVPEPRVLRVHLPDAYLRDPDRRFPVVYALDGQNAFDASTSYGGVEWCLDDIALQLEQEGEPPCIVVGVDNGCERRMHEYSFCPPPRPPKPAQTLDEAIAENTEPVGDAKDGEAKAADADPKAADAAPAKAAEPAPPAEPEPPPEDGGGAKEHLDFILYEVAPLIRARFRVDPAARYLVGSSMGGLFGLWAAIAHPGAFRGIASLSPSVWWARQAVLSVPLGDGPRPRVWIDMGSRESKAMVQQFHGAVRRLEDLGWKKGEDLRPVLVKGGSHHESSWADRSSSVLRFLLADHR